MTTLLKRNVLSVCLLTMLHASCASEEKLVEVEQWTTHELIFNSDKTYGNAYTDQDLWVQFISDKGDSIVRPAFWDGGNTWKVRFAPIDAGSTWSWTSFASVDDNGLIGKKGSFVSVPYKGNNPLIKRGLLRMSPGKRNVVHADSTPFLLVGDTPWSLPFRATTEQASIYAQDRKAKGFNTALLLTVQPDINAKGPEARNTIEGFDRGFEDLSEGHLNKLKPDYFQTLDSLVDILLEHQLTPVYAPVAHGYGWRGEIAIGSSAVPVEYARYAKYLVARYGSKPALYLINLDGNALAPGVKPAGEMIEKWDGYAQPVGLHYSPYDDWLAKWAKDGDSSCCFHFNRRYQEEKWLDFQWAQTGHDGLHLYHKVERMYSNQPTKGGMNGESTYEAMGEGKLGLGWWQGEDAWNQLMHGGTMGVVYGAVSLWQWKIAANEPGWPEWTNAPLSWRQAMDLEGSKYVGMISKAFQGFDFTDMERRWDLPEGNKPLLAKEGKFYVSYLHTGGNITIKGVPEGIAYYWFNPKTGDMGKSEKTQAGGSFDAPDSQPWVLLIGERK